jgi:hypothetical protein
MGVAQCSECSSRISKWISSQRDDQLGARRHTHFRSPGSTVERILTPRWRLFMLPHVAGCSGALVEVPFSLFITTQVHPVLYDRRPSSSVRL